MAGILGKTALNLRVSLKMVAFPQNLNNQTKYLKEIKGI